jgi:hypothetical protein
MYEGGSLQCEVWNESLATFVRTFAFLHLTSEILNVNRRRGAHSQVQTQFAQFVLNFQ